jgi:hypothetical protein
LKIENCLLDLCELDVQAVMSAAFVWQGLS